MSDETPQRDYGILATVAAARMTLYKGTDGLTAARKADTDTGIPEAVRRATELDRPEYLKIIRDAESKGGPSQT